jgi:hypothetical protein
MAAGAGVMERQPVLAITSETSAREQAVRLAGLFVIVRRLGVDRAVDRAAAQKNN